MFVVLSLDDIITSRYFPPTLPAILAFSLWTIKGICARLFYVKEDGDVSLPYRDFLFTLASRLAKYNEKRTIRKDNIDSCIFKFSSYLSSIVLFQLQKYVPKWAFLAPVIAYWGISSVTSFTPEVSIIIFYNTQRKKDFGNAMLASFFGVPIYLLLSALKLAHVIDWNWEIVHIPFWGFVCSSITN